MKHHLHSSETTSFILVPRRAFFIRGMVLTIGLCLANIIHANSFFKATMQLYQQQIIEKLAKENPQFDLLNSCGAKAEYLPKHSFIDSHVPDAASLQVLLQETDEQVFHLFSHGQLGQLLLEGKWQTAPQIAHWLTKNKYLSHKSHLNIYGCHFAQGKKGRVAVEYLEAALGISIAASDDITGISGDWELEVGLAKHSLSLPTYAHNLQDCNQFTKISDTQGNLSNPLNDGDVFGASLETLGDLDGDGINDVLVGAFGDDDLNLSNGAAYILFLNADGSVKAEQKISGTQGGMLPQFNSPNFMGFGVSSLGDVNGDGITDVVLGSLRDDDGGSDKGAVHVLFLNTDGTVQGQQKISALSGNLMTDISNGNFFSVPEGIGDLDGDGIPDLAVGAYRNLSDNGRVVILFLNADGTVKAEQDITQGTGGLIDLPDDSRFGRSVANLGDIDGDGVIDLAVGAALDDDGENDAGAIYILFMNTDGTVKAQQKISNTEGGLPPILGAGGNIGISVSTIGDLDGDGVNDMAFGAPLDNDGGTRKGAVYFVLLNSNGTVKEYHKLSETTTGSPFMLDDNDRFGYGLTHLGDLDGDGYTNIGIGTRNDDDGGVDRGAVYVIDIQYIAGEIQIQAECPASVVNTISVPSTTVCDGDNLPMVNNVAFDLVSSASSSYFDGAETALVKWEMSSDGTTWTEIVGVTTLDFTGTVPFSPNTFIRRVFEYDCPSCSLAPSYSNVIEFTSGGTSAEVEILPITYCPSSDVSTTISPTVTGGTGPFTYSWLPTAGLSDPTVQNPTVTFGSSDLYELTVTGADGCMVTTSAILIPIEADAGGNLVYICPGETGISIGMNRIPGLTDITYAWTPTTDLSCSDCPNPIASPNSTTTYTLTVDDGNGCVSMDDITVNTDAFEADAGPDIYLCQGETAVIGTPTQAGIEYGWAPGLYINSQTIAQPTFFSGVIPIPNPYTYTLTAYDPVSLCYSIDTMVAHVAYAIAADQDTIPPTCGPVQVGEDDCCSGQATYSWAIISGDANSFYDTLSNTFTTTSNIPNPYVYPTTQTTGYELTVTWGPNGDNSGGAVCRDTVYVPVSCGDGCPVIDLNFENEQTCGVGTAGATATTWNATTQEGINPAFWDFSWSPATNLSCTDCANPSLTANLNSTTTYTLTITSKGTGIMCTQNITVHPSTGASPVATAKEGDVCAGIGANIGSAPVAGWDYSWTPTTDLDDPTSSNPFATPSSTTEYTLVVTDAVTGCMADTTITVRLINFSGSAGEDFTLCQGATGQLGSSNFNPEYTYSWSPTTDLDDASLPQPTVTGNSTTTYTLTITTPAGCMDTDDITVTVVNGYTVNAEDVEICENGSSSLLATVDGISPADLTYNWSPSTGLNSTTTASPVVSGLTSTTMYSVTVSGDGCTGIGSATVTVNPLPNLSLSAVNKCNTPVQIGTTALAGYSYTWSPIEGLDDPNIANPMADPGATTTYTVIVRDDMNCEDSFTQTVNVLAPTANAGPDLTVCEGQAVSIGAVAAEAGATYSWSPTTYLDDPNVAQTIARPEMDITYTLTATDNGCTATDEITITVTPKPENTGNLDPFIFICENNCQTIGVENNILLTYQWLPASAVSTPNASMTEICPTENVNLSLVVTDPSTGCSEIKDMSVFISTGGNCTCDLDITTVYSSNCSGDDTNGYTADWNIGIAVTTAPDNAISYQRNSEAVQSHTLTGTTDTLTIAGIPADGGVSDTLKVWFTNDVICGDTIILKRPLPCPSDISTCSSTSGCLGGNVFEDFNCNGTDDTNEPGVQGVQVQVYDCNNALVGTSSSDSDGDWQVCGLTDGVAYRIEHILPEAIACWATPTHVGTDNGSDIQFVTAPACTKFSVSSPTDYCQANPFLVTPCYVNGAVSGTGPTDVLVRWSYNNSGNGPDDLTEIAAKDEIGATWGLAYASSTKKVYTSAVLKRHVGMLDDDSDGFGDIGAIYQTNVDGSGTPNLLITIPNVGSIGDDATRNLGNADAINQDNSVLADVMKIGLGDLDISEDEKTLYVTNLNEKSLVEIDIATQMITNTYPIPNPCNSTGTNRPFAIGIQKGQIYIGLVCDASNSGNPNDLSAHIYQLQGSTFTPVLTYNLDYNKDAAVTENSPARDGWFAWSDNYDDLIIDHSNTVRVIAPTPVLSDIDFDANGNMVMGFLDRTAFIGGFQNGTPFTITSIGGAAFTGDGDFEFITISGGDVLRATANGMSGYTLEANPGTMEFFDDNSLVASHQESSLGGLTINKLTNELVHTVLDPVNQFHSFGVEFNNLSSGVRTNEFRVFGNPAGDNTAYFGKGAALGDLILACDPAPLEIGNYVWCDSLENGIQDACERGINDIIVQLYDRNGNLVGQDTTSNSGQYYFNQNNVDTTGITVDGSGIATPVTVWSGMSYATQYFIVFGGGQFSINEFTVGGETYGITSMANAGSNDNIDSDVDRNNLTAGSLGARPDGLPFIDMTTSAQGCGDHKYDLGVTCSPCPEIAFITSPQVICSGDALDTLAITTTVTHPDSISFVYFTAPQTDSTLIYNNGININTLQVNSGNDTLRLTNVNIPAFTNLSAQADTVYIYAIQAPAPSQATCRPYAEIQVIVLPLPEVTTTITCDDNDTGSDANDDTFTITVLGTNVTPGPSGEYLVIYNGATLNGSGTAYGMEATVTHADFVANGVFSPTLTIRDIDDGCEVTTTIAPVDNCSACPTELCLPIKVVIKRGE